MFNFDVLQTVVIPTKYHPTFRTSFVWRLCNIALLTKKLKILKKNITLSTIKASVFRRKSKNIKKNNIALPTIKASVFWRKCQNIKKNNVALPTIEASVFRRKCQNIKKHNVTFATLMNCRNTDEQLKICKKKWRDSRIASSISCHGFGWQVRDYIFKFCGKLFPALHSKVWLFHNSYMFPASRYTWRHVHVFLRGFIIAI